MIRQAIAVPLPLTYDEAGYVGQTISKKFNIERLGQPAFICLWLALITCLPSGVKPVRFPRRASIFGPISSRS
jgi:hypothetical protein